MTKKPPLRKRSIANERQHGGNHYKNKAIEPWDYIAANDMGFWLVVL